MNQNGVLEHVVNHDESEKTKIPIKLDNIGIYFTDNITLVIINFMYVVKCGGRKIELVPSPYETMSQISQFNLSGNIIQTSLIRYLIPKQLDHVSATILNMIKCHFQNVMELSRANHKNSLY